MSLAEKARRLIEAGAANARPASMPEMRRIPHAPLVWEMQE
jgi:hypothetical protein